MYVHKSPYKIECKKTFCVYCVSINLYKCFKHNNIAKNYIFENYQISVRCWCAHTAFFFEKNMKKVFEKFGGE